jgi:hypothetical protein
MKQKSPEQTLKSIDKALEKLARPPRKRPRRFSVAPIYLGLGLLLADQLLVRFVPMVWASALPGGIEQANLLHGWPRLVWALSRLFSLRSAEVIAILGTIAVIGFIVSLVRPLRPFVWLAAIAVVACDAAILILAVKTAMDLTMHQVGLG